MELSELKQAWAQLDSRIAENTRINKIMLQQVLSRKPKNRLLFLKMEVTTRLALLLVLLIVFLIQFDGSPFSPWGFSLAFFTVLSGAYAYSLIKELIWMNRLHFSLPMLTCSKLLLRLEKQKLFLWKLNLWGNIPAIGFFVAMSFLKPNFWQALKQDLLLPLLIITVGGGLFAFFKLRFMRKQLRKLNAELQEITDLQQ